MYVQYVHRHNFPANNKEGGALTLLSINDEGDGEWAILNELNGGEIKNILNSDA